MYASRGGISYERAMSMSMQELFEWHIRLGEVQGGKWVYSEDDVGHWAEEESDSG
jgi:hypothetical protein